MKHPITLALILLPVFCGSAIAADETVDESTATQYLSLSIDRVVIETEGVTQASNRLADSVDRLALALQQLSTRSDALDAADKQVLLDAIRSVDRAGSALAKLADELPQTARELSRELPQVIENTRQPIAELSTGLRSARDGILAVTTSLPEATDNAKLLIDSALDSALMKISAYSVMLIVALALALIVVSWFIYRQYLAPIAARLEPLAVAPEHFAELSRYLKETSDNLLVLQQTSRSAPSGSGEQGDNKPV